MDVHFRIQKYTIGPHFLALIAGANVCKCTEEAWYLYKLTFLAASRAQHREGLFLRLPA